MSQHDLSIANQGFPAFRSDLNSGLQALGSLSSGATEPATIYAYQLWADTTTGLLKIRNAANTGWVTIGTMASTNLGLQPLDAELTAIAGLASTGLITKTGTGTAVERTITGTTNVITVTNGNGVSGNPTLTVGSLVARTDVVNAFTVAQRGTVDALTDGATITPDFAASNNFSLTLGGNRTLANPTNLVAGQSGVIVITQDATGSRTLAYGSYFKFASGTAPTLTTTASAVDVLAYYVESATRITARLIGDVK